MAAAARSILRSSASLLRAAPARSTSSAARPSLHHTLGAPPRLLRSPVEASFCVESLLPLHSATAAARMTSMLAVPGRGLGWLTEGQDETRLRPPGDWGKLKMMANDADLPTEPEDY